MLLRHRKMFRLSAVTTILIMALEITAPLATYALSGGPVQPDITNFEPVASSGMVNNFTGDFTYSLPIINIPGAHGGGYAMGLSYNSGVQPEEEASWVGYGWTLNPGAILRGTRGYPDDRYGDETTNPLTQEVNPADHVVEYNRVKPNWTLEVKPSQSLEVASFDVATIENAAYLNSYTGFGFRFGLSGNLPGFGSLSVAVSNGDPTINFEASHSNLWLMIIEEAINEIRGDNEHGFVSRLGQKLAGVRSSNLRSPITRFGTYYYTHTMAGNSFPTNVSTFSSSESVRQQYTAGLSGLSAIPDIGIQNRMNASWSKYVQRESVPTDTWGYYYNFLGQTTSDDALDYYVEKESPMHLRDRYLSLPFANADQFIVSGQGIGGGFRAFNARTGIYRPVYSKGEVEITQVGAELGLGVGVAVGLDLGIGYDEQTIESWSVHDGLSEKFYFAEEPEYSNCSRTPEANFFRFNNDLGGRVEFSSNDEPFPTDLEEIWPIMNQGERSTRSSNIRMATNEDVIAKRGLTNWSTYQSMPIRGRVPKGIGEYGITTPQGANYIYGLPVYSVEEATLTYLDDYLKNDAELRHEADNFTASLHHASTHQPNFNRQKAILDKPETKVVGRYSPRPYASSFLLTEVQSADYIDVGQNGPGNEDIGGWVKFEYENHHGDVEHPLIDKDAPYADNDALPSSSWYRYRMPYSGLQYDPGTLNDPSDDRGRVQTGYRQTYYLERVETNTHVAIFHTSPRMDGVSASEDEEALLKNEQSDDNFVGAKYQKKLDKIELFAKGVDGTVDLATDPPVRTIHFEYDEIEVPSESDPNVLIQSPLMIEIPNADDQNGKKGSQSKIGRLTLRKVWFEYQGVHSAQLTAYQFNYKYPEVGDPGITADLQNAYPEALDFLGNLDAKEQNPPYDPRNVDKWGNYAFNEGTRKLNYEPGVNQNPSLGDFDPAAWHLKEIVTPSGGRIFVEYEQDDYKYVQNKNAMVLCPLFGDTQSENYGVDDTEITTSNLGNEYFLDPASIFDGEQDVDSIRALMEEIYVDGRQPVYFKFLYSIDSDQASLPDLSDPDFECEYIDGYLPIDKVWVEDQDGSPRIGVSFPISPQLTCLRWNSSNAVHSEASYDAREKVLSGDFLDQIEVAGSLLARSYGLAGVHFSSEACKRFHPRFSYVRIPVDKMKRGGGVRVKKLLMYDEGINGDGGVSLYGNEYIYRLEDNVTSSGVATNEPTAMREENPLIRIIGKRENQSFMERVSVGRDREQFEGPMGESLLPSPQVGYSRVVVKNIYDNRKNGSGFAVHEYFTYKDYPFEVHKGEDQTTTFKATDHPISHSYTKVSLPGGSFSSRERVSARQGYSFVLNAMNGRPKQMRSCGGVYDEPLTHVENASQSYTYYEPGEKVPMFYGLDEVFRMEQPGKEMDVAMESRLMTREVDSGSLEVDIHGLLFGVPIIIPTSAPAVQVQSNKVFQFVTTKVVRYPVLVKSVTSVQDDISHTTENVAFDPVSGQAVVTRTTDGFDGLVLGANSGTHNGAYHHYNLKAWLQYADMRQKSLTESAVIPTTKGGAIGNVKMHLRKEAQQTGPDKTYLQITVGNQSAPKPRFVKYVADNMIRPGDIIEAEYEEDMDGNPIVNVYHVGELRSESSGDISYYLYQHSHIVPEISSFPSELQQVKILRSGRDNALGASVGSIVTYGEDKSDAIKWANELARREAIAQRLNARLVNCQDYFFLHSWDIPEGLPIKIAPDMFENTEKWDLEHGLKFEVDQGSRTIDVTGHRIACGTEAAPNPVVTKLNDYLDALWGTDYQTLASFDTEFMMCPAPADVYYEESVSTSLNSTLEANLNTQYVSVAGAQIAQEACLFGGTTGSAQLKDCKITLSTAMGPNPFTANQVGFMRKGVGTSTRRPMAVNIVYGDQEIPLLRCYVGTPNVQLGSSCDLEWGFIPGTDEGLANAFPTPLSRDDFTSVSNGTTTWDVLFNPSGNSSTKFTELVGRFTQDNEGYLKFKNLIGDVEYKYPMTFTMDVSVAPDKTQSAGSTTLEMSETGPGKFKVSNSGQLVYVADDDDQEQAINLLQFLSTGFEFASNAGPVQFNNTVIAANAMTYSDDWDYDLGDYVSQPTFEDNDYYWNKRGRFRPARSYAIREKTGLTVPNDGARITAAQQSGARSWEMGMMEQFTPFDFGTEQAQIAANEAANWFSTGTISHYSPHGEVLESRDILDLPSSVVFGYNGLLPVAVAGNAALGTYWFESFEELGTISAMTTSDHAHAGVRSFEFGPNDYVYDELIYDQQWHDHGGVTRFWVRYESMSPPRKVGDSDLPTVTMVVNGNSLQEIPAELVSRMGEWNLYKAMLPKEQLSQAAVGNTVSLRYSNARSESVQLDDVRIQPYHSGMVAYVYDLDDLRILASFDEQNFGLFYQYNAEGKLVRSIVESLAGRKTVVENYAHIPKKYSRSALTSQTSGMQMFTPDSRNRGLLQGVPQPKDLVNSLGGNHENGLNSSLGDQQVNAGSFEFGRTITLPDSLSQLLNSVEGSNED